MYFIEVAYLILLRTFPLQFVPSQIFSFFAGGPYHVIDLPISFSAVTVEKERFFVLTNRYMVRKQSLNGSWFRHITMLSLRFCQK